MGQHMADGTGARGGGGCKDSDQAEEAEYEDVNKWDAIDHVNKGFVKLENAYYGKTETLGNWHARKMWIHVVSSYQL